MSCLGNRCSCRRDDSGGTEGWNAEVSSASGEQGRGLAGAGVLGDLHCVRLADKTFSCTGNSLLCFSPSDFLFPLSGFGLPKPWTTSSSSPTLFSVPPQLGKRNKVRVWARGSTSLDLVHGPCGVGPTASFPMDCRRFKNALKIKR